MISSFWTISSSVGLRIKIQSLRPPWVVEERVENFLAAFGDTLASMSEEEFVPKKDGLIVRYLERNKNIDEEAAKFWTQISTGYYDFLRGELWYSCVVQSSYALSVLQTNSMQTQFDR